MLDVMKSLFTPYVCISIAPTRSCELVVDARPGISSRQTGVLVPIPTLPELAIDKSEVKLTVPVVAGECMKFRILLLAFTVGAGCMAMPQASEPVLRSFQLGPVGS